MIREVEGAPNREEALTHALQEFPELQEFVTQMLGEIGYHEPSEEVEA